MIEDRNSSSNEVEDTKMLRTIVPAAVKNSALLKQIYPSSSFVISPNRQYSYGHDNPQNLPKQPVPKLDDTLSKFLRSCKPLLTDSEFSEATELVKDFGKSGGFGQTCQKHLEDRAKTESNWLSQWWQDFAYLGYRVTVVSNSNPGQCLPAYTFNNEDERLEFAAKLTLGAMSYKMLIDGNKIKTEMAGKNQLDMRQYKLIYGTCRIPALPIDKMEYHPESTHIVVMHNNHFFKLKVMYNGKPPSQKQLVRQLKSIVQKSPNKCPAVGLLSADDRDPWATAFQELVSDAKNKENASIVQKSLFVLCLDGPLPAYPNDNRYTVIGKLAIHGGGSKYNTGNRWFDKTVQFIVGPDGNSGMSYEHSPAEGGPIAILADYVVTFIAKDSGKAFPDVKCEEPIELTFKVNDKIQGMINEAAGRVDKLVADLDLFNFKFPVYGKDFIKSQKLSPDSYIQMAMQYAYFRLNGEPTGHYESAALRRYLHGRTETIRSTSVESVAFAKAMLSAEKSPADKVKALKTAINSHKKYSADASLGMGVDRHLLGLRLVAQQKNIKIHPLYNHISVTKSGKFVLATSQVPVQADTLMCYGPVWHDGYGICYNPHNKDIIFGVSSFHSCKKTSSNAMKKALEDCLKDMQQTLLKAGSKL